MNFSGIDPEIEGSARRCIRVSVRELEKKGEKNEDRCKEQGRMSWYGNCWLRWRTVLQDFRSNTTCKMYMIPNLREHGQVRMQSMTHDCEEPQKYSSLPSARVASSPHIASPGLGEICLWVPISASTATRISSLSFTPYCTGCHRSTPAIRGTSCPRNIAHATSRSDGTG
jgi:hypothetical protein